MHRTRRYLVGVALCSLVYWWLTCLPTPLFDAPFSQAVYGQAGELLSARIASDGQWRLPPQDSLDVRYATAVQLFEDEYFAWHPGVNPVSVGRALRQNLAAGSVVSGASTLTMQTVRLMRGKRSRTVGEKLMELIWATRLELTYRKAEILAMYAAHAPFGGNVVGLEAAAWRYYGRAAQHLSWAEAAALAVLPNAPGVLFPGRGQGEFLRKRNGLLDKLASRGHLDSLALVLAKAEPLPGKPHRLPMLAQHYLMHTGPNSEQTLDARLQRTLTAAVDRHHDRWRGQGVHHGGVVVLDVATGRTMAYVGNTRCPLPESATAVDVARARRSSGSILKPFLYAKLLDEGHLSPQALVADIPTLIAGYAPQNFEQSFDGAVPAGEALTRSLNVPFVRLLRTYGVAPFLEDLRHAGFTTLDRSADHYGLSLILGGGEIRLVDVASAYRGLALTALGQASTSGISPEAAFLTLETLTQLERPGDLAAWRSFAGSRTIAWKTGTSFGHRDAWAVGVTPEYVVAVWTGNASGEGKPGLTGARAAAPLLFEAFEALPPTTWFAEPVADMDEVACCRASGYQAGAPCPHLDTILLPPGGQRLALCNFHERVYVDAAGFRVDASCAELSSSTRMTSFVLPPSWANYYRRHHAEYLGRPAWSTACEARDESVLSLVYPRDGQALLLPRGLNGTRQAVAVEVAHAEPSSVVHWYLDGEWLAQTQRVHQLPLKPSPGTHTLHWVDYRGRTLDWTFRVQ